MERDQAECASSRLAESFNESIGSETGFPVRRRKLLRHVKTQTGLKAANKKVQVGPENHDQSLQACTTLSSSSAQTTPPLFSTTATEPLHFPGLDRAVQVGQDREKESKQTQSQVQTEERGTETMDFYVKSVACQVQRLGETRGIQVEVNCKHAAAQWDVRSCDKPVQTEKRPNYRLLKQQMGSLRTSLQALTVQISKEMQQFTSALQALVPTSLTSPSPAVLCELRTALSRAIATHQEEAELWDSERCELQLKLELLQNEQADYYLLNRQLEDLFSTAVEDKSQAQIELLAAKEAAAGLEKQLFALRLEAIDCLGDTQGQSEAAAFALQVKVAQNDIEILNFTRILSEKEAKIRENQEIVDLLQGQIENAVKDCERLRADNQLNTAFYQGEVERLQDQLASARFQQRQFQQGNRTLSEEMEGLRGMLEEYELRTEVLAQGKSKSEVDLKSALFDLKHANSEAETMRKSISRLQKQVRDYEETLQKDRVLHLAATDSTTGETFDTEVQIQQLESEKLELQTEVVELRSTCEERKDQLQAGGQALRQLQEAFDFLRIKNVTLENALGLSKSALSETKQQREAAEKKAAELSTQLNSLRSLLRTRENDLETSHSALNALQMQLKTALQACEQHRSQCASLGKLLEDTQGRLLMESRGRLEAESLLKQVQSLSDSKEKRWIAEKEELVTLNEQLSGRIDSLQREGAGFEAEIAVLRSKKAEMDTQMAAERKALESQREEMAMERLVWEERRLKAENGLEKAEIAANSLKKEITGLRTEIVALQTQEKEHNEEIKTLQQALSDAKRSNSLQAAELLFTQTQISNFERCSTSFQAQIALLTSESEATLLQLDSLKQVKDTLEDQLAASQSACSRLSEDLEALQSQVESLRGELVQTQGKLRGSEQAEEKLVSKKEELTERLVWYQAEYEKASALKKANIALTERNLALAAELRTLSDKSQY